MITSRRSSSERVAEWRMPVDLFVDGGVFLDVHVGLGDVGLRLVVIVVADEVLHRVVREELLELAVELGRQGLVVGQTRVGTLSLAMTLAMVKVLPEPVTPRSTWWAYPARTPATSLRMAWGWSPAGVNDVTKWN